MRSLHTRLDTISLTKPKFTIGGPRKRVDSLMGIPVPESAQQDLAFIRNTISITISQLQKFSTLADINYAVTDLHPGWYVQAIRINHRLVGPAVSIKIAQKNHFVIRQRPWLDLWIDVGTCNISVTASVPANGQWIGYPEGLIRKEIDLKAIKCLEGLQFLLDICLIGATRFGGFPIHYDLSSEHLLFSFLDEVGISRPLLLERG